VVIGGRALSRLPIDAFPNTTPVQERINIAVPSLAI
jgi:Cu/Ag efflux pump CusA